MRLGSGGARKRFQEPFAVTDFADGFDLDGQPGTADGAVAGLAFVPLVLELPRLLDPAELTVAIAYPASDPAGVTCGGDPPVYVLPGEGRLRLWLKDGEAARRKHSIAHPEEPGDYVPAGTFDATLLGFSAERRTVTLYVEAVRRSDANADLRVAVEVTRRGAPAEEGAVGLDAVRLTAVTVDLDIDSDNDSGFDAPERDPAEDRFENTVEDDSHPGKVLLVDNEDSDGDGIPDFADGFNYVDGVEAEDTSAGSRLVPMVLEIPPPTDLSQARIELTYPACNPADLHPTLDDPYPLPPGHLRLWRKDGDQPRDKRGLSQGGDYVAPGVAYTAEALGVADRTLVLYVEAVRKSTSTADLPIRVRVYPAGVAGANAFSCQDQVRLTAPQERTRNTRNTRKATASLQPRPSCVVRLFRVFRVLSSSDLRPLADLPALATLHLSGCDQVVDLSPLRAMARRGGQIEVPDRLREQLDALRK